MAITTLPLDGAPLTPTESAQHAAALKKKLALIIFTFILSLVTFVCQTEFTTAAYKLGFKEPIFLLFLTHGMWWTLWPTQVLALALWRTYDKYQRDQKLVRERRGSNDRRSAGATGGGDARYQRLNSQSQLLEGQQLDEFPLHIVNAPTTSYYNYFRKAIVKQVHSVYHTLILIFESNVNDDYRTENINLLVDKNPHIANTNSITDCLRSLWSTPSFQYCFRKSFWITIVLTFAGITWYVSMSMTYASDVTAIYNCSAFTAYAFAIPLLNERFLWLKATSVVIAVSGVFVVAYSDGSSDGESDTEVVEEYPYRVWGNLLIFFGAILYGYYEVLYKKYLCIGDHISKIITPRRQMTFANFVMVGLGVCTFFILGVSMLFCEITSIHKFNLVNYGDDTFAIWMYIVGLSISNLLFSGLFLTLMALTLPVLSSVSSLLTIFLIGIVEWVLFGTTLSAQQLIGDFLVIVGFVFLTVASWKEISEGQDEGDDVEAISVYSMAISTDGV